MTLLIIIHEALPSTQTLSHTFHIYCQCPCRQPQ